MLKKVLLLFSAVCFLFCCACSPQTIVEEPNSVSKMILEDAYVYAQCEYPWAEHGTDWSYITIDSNPYDYDNSDYPSLSTKYLSDAVDAIKKVNEKLGLPASLYESINNTSALMGRQTKTYSSIGIEVSWFYHPDSGIDVTYEIIVS